MARLDLSQPSVSRHLKQLTPFLFRRRGEGASSSIAWAWGRSSRRFARWCASSNRKLDNAEATGAEVIVTANPGCHLQLAGGLGRRGSSMRVRHIVEILDQSYRG